jgi:hemerythrin-like domain-containing protein
MHEILQALRQEHRNIVSLINTLEWQVAEFERGNTPDYDVISANVEYFLNFPDLFHHPKEDLVFAKLRERDAAAAAGIDDLRRAHQELGVRTREFSAGLHAVLDELEIPRDAFVRRARRFIELQRQHIEMEETRFFPAADKALTAEDWADLKARTTTGEDPLFGENVPAKFDRLRRTILAWQAQDELIKRESEV